MIPIYRKSQIGWFVIIFILPFILFLAWAFFARWGDNPIPVFLLLVLEGFFLLMLLLFYKLTVDIYPDHIRLVYGIGVIQIRVKVDALEEVSIIKTPWYWGLGIRITPRGMLYNIQGLHAVEISYQRAGKSKSVMIGTAEPTNLRSAISDTYLKR